MQAVTVTEASERVLFNRRRFLQGAAMVAAVSFLGVDLSGCGGKSELLIPCLGKAAAPTPVPGMTYIRASELGCALDCDLASGRNKYTGAAATDDGPRINAAMAGAKADHPITLIIDGSALISGLFLPSDGHWSIAGLGCGTGFFVKSGTNNDGIHNGPPSPAIRSNPGPPAPHRGANVSLSNFTLNGNQGNGRNGDSTTGQRQGNQKAWYYGINLMNLDNIVIEKVVVVNTPAYHFRFSNVGNVSVSGCVMQSQGQSTDGLHFDGPSNDITISDCRFATGDDAIALNCPEGYSGDISRVTVTNCKFYSWTLMRLYTTDGVSKFRIDSVKVSNCSAILREAAFLVGLNPNSLPAAIADLTITDCQFTAPAALGLAENFGNIYVKNTSFTPSRANVVWVRPQVNTTCGFLRPSPMNGNRTCIGSSVKFEDCKVVRTRDLDTGTVILGYNSNIGQVQFDGYSVQDAGSYSPVRELIDLGSGSIGNLILDSVKSANIQGCIQREGFHKVESVSGTGVLKTDWRFPDFVMADNVPFISAETGLPSIKINGVVEPYSPS